MKSVIERAAELFNDERFRCGDGNPQQYHFEVAHGMTRLSLERWTWKAACTASRLERALENGLAIETGFGIIYFDISSEFGGRSLARSFEDCPPGLGY